MRKVKKKNKEETKTKQKIEKKPLKNQKSNFQ